jgi:Phytanoyl-CoA dioxygenase (PhyH)
MTFQIDPDGFALSPSLISGEKAWALVDALGEVSGAGRRGMLQHPVVADFSRSEVVLRLLRPHLALEPRPVRAIYFDKSQEANWLVPWHQDLTIAVEKHRDVEGFGPWSMKDGVPHVQPPIPLLEGMIALRLHLDDADEENGALKVLPGSHRLGRLSAADIERCRTQTPQHLCRAKAGDALLMRPLLLHASGKSTSPRRRRILHLEYAGVDLPPELSWHEGG